MSDDTPFVVNARDVEWRGRVGLVGGEPEGDADSSLASSSWSPPGSAACMSTASGLRRPSWSLGECVLVIEGEERPLKQWDFVHCPPMADTSSSARATARARS